MAITSLPGGKTQEDVLVGIVQRWTQKDPATAAAWVARFPEGALRSAAVENLVKLWVPQNDAATWLDALPPGASRDSGLRAYAEQIAPAHPREAATWAAAIANPQMQAAQLERSIRAWKESDPSSATQWLRTAALSSTLRNRLLENQTKP